MKILYHCWVAWCIWCSDLNFSNPTRGKHSEDIAATTLSGKAKGCAYGYCSNRGSGTEKGADELLPKKLNMFGYTVAPEVGVRYPPISLFVVAVPVSYAHFLVPRHRHTSRIYPMNIPLYTCTSRYTGIQSLQRHMRMHVDFHDQRHVLIGAYSYSLHRKG